MTRSAEPIKLTKTISVQAVVFWFGGSAILLGCQASLLVCRETIGAVDVLRVLGPLGFTYAFGSKLLHVLNVIAGGPSTTSEKMEGD